MKKVVQGGGEKLNPESHFFFFIFPQTSKPARSGFETSKSTQAISLVFVRALGDHPQNPKRGVIWGQKNFPTLCAKGGTWERNCGHGTRKVPGEATVRNIKC